MDTWKLEIMNTSWFSLHVIGIYMNLFCIYHIIIHTDTESSLISGRCILHMTVLSSFWAHLIFTWGFTTSPNPAPNPITQSASKCPTWSYKPDCDWVTVVVLVVVKVVAFLWLWCFCGCGVSVLVVFLWLCFWGCGVPVVVLFLWLCCFCGWGVPIMWCYCTFVSVVVKFLWLCWSCACVDPVLVLLLYFCSCGCVVPAVMVFLWLYFCGCVVSAVVAILWLFCFCGWGGVLFLEYFFFDDSKGFYYRSL